MSVKKKIIRRPTPSHRKSSPLDTSAIVKLIREGVERFVLKDAPIGDFRRAIKSAAKKGEVSSHPLTGTIFRAIVKAAIKERNRRARKIPTMSSRTNGSRKNAKNADRDH